jgi:predicted anti-sigma-YlaC factor YlaD
MEIRMKCLQFENSISEIVRGERKLSPEEERHLQSCKNCSEQMKSARQLSIALQITREDSRGLSASTRVQNNLLEELRKRKGTKHVWMWRLSRIAAVLFFIALTASWVVRHQKPEDTAQPIESAAQADSTEITTGFIPLTHGSLASSSVQMIRVKLPRSALMQFGLPVNVDHPDQMIDADVIVGEEGLPHAIRFIESTNFNDSNQEEK